MTILVGIPRETFPGERRVAMIPRACEPLQKAGMNVLTEHSAGADAGSSDDHYAAHAARLASRAEVFREVGIIVQLRCLGANPETGRADLGIWRSGQTLIGFGEPLSALKECSDLAATGVSSLAMEPMPGSPAQSMDALSSMATISGYQAVLLAATSLPKMFPALMTAAGIVTPAKVFILGAGVAGLQRPSPPPAAWARWPQATTYARQSRNR